MRARADDLGKRDEVNDELLGGEAEGEDALRGKDNVERAGIFSRARADEATGG